jgi:hypothetical protein
MKITFDVTTTDGVTHRVSTVYADIIAMERKFNIDASELATRQRAEWLGFLAWNALKRSGDTSEPFDKFVLEIDSLAPVDLEDGPGNG